MYITLIIGTIFVNCSSTMLSTRIKELRAVYKLSIKDFARHCGLSEVAIYYLESDKRASIRKSTIEKLTKVYGVTYEWIMFGEGEMLPNGKSTLLTNNENVELNSQKLIEELQSKNKFLENELERVWRIVEYGQKAQV